jgi:HD superfamily phosphodiesterase
MFKQDRKLAEDKWGKPIHQYLSALFNKKWLPSHDIAHHTRVWQNACEICNAIELKYPVQDAQFYEKLIIACFFHDVGLLNDSSETHGKSSRKICEKFLHLHTDMVSFDGIEMLETIENHDKKNYDLDSNAGIINFFNILSIADDIDAFGAIGAYRYMEIYLIRNINPRSIPEKILDNAKKRYENFTHVIKKIPFSSQTIDHKYNELKNLFLIRSFQENAVSLVQWIDEKIVKPRKQPQHFFQTIDTTTILNQRILAFIQKYIKESNES